MRKHNNIAVLEEERWLALERRDRMYDGLFFYGVVTTGVYCRPSCGSRLPRRENVCFYDTASAAEVAGLRPCQRCKPEGTLNSSNLGRIREICRYLETHLDGSVTLKHLSERAGLTPQYLQRSFKTVVGISPKQYLDHLRMERFKGSLRKNDGEVTSAIFDAGYGSLSRLYEKLDTHLGMTPMEYRGGGKGMAISYATFTTPLGLVMVGATDRGLCFVQFGEDGDDLRRQLRQHYPMAELNAMREPATPQFQAWVTTLNAYLEGKTPDLQLPVHVRATAFQLLVWTHLQKIPAGKVESYQEVAKAVAKPSAARAVARACASNPVAVVIPCHRVIRGDGGMGGYRWGIGRKRTLLDTERRLASGN